MILLLCDKGEEDSKIPNDDSESDVGMWKRVLMMTLLARRWLQHSWIMASAMKELEMALKKSSVTADYLVKGYSEVHPWLEACVSSGQHTAH